MLADTHKRVLVYPVAATRQLVSTEAEQFVHCVYRVLSGGCEEVSEAALDAVIEAPAEFERILAEHPGTIDWMQAWVTLRFMDAWRKNLDAHNGRSRRFYKAFLQTELHALHEEEEMPPPPPPVDEEVRRMWADTHKRVLLCPVAAIRLFIDEYSEGYAWSEVVHWEFGEDDVDDLDHAARNLYETAIDAPATFERVLYERMEPLWDCHEVRNVRAWLTLRFMNAWRTDPDAHDGRSRRFYKTFLEAELHALREAEAAQARA